MSNFDLYYLYTPGDVCVLVCERVCVCVLVAIVHQGGLFPDDDDDDGDEDFPGL